MSRHLVSLLSTLAASLTLATAADAQQPYPGGYYVTFGGAGSPIRGGQSYVPIRGYSNPSLPLTTANAPQSAPYSIYPGPGPNVRPVVGYYPSFSYGGLGGYGGYGYDFGYGSGLPYGVFEGYGYDAFGLFPASYVANAGEYLYPISSIDAAEAIASLIPTEPPVYVTPRNPENPIQGFPPAEIGDPTRARLTLNVPASAEVWLQGRKQDQTGTARVFQSPDLGANQTFTFNVRVRWMEGDKPVEEKRTLAMRAGQSQSLTYVALPPQPTQARR